MKLGATPAGRDGLPSSPTPDAPPCSRRRPEHPRCGSGRNACRSSARSTRARRCSPSSRFRHAGQQVAAASRVSGPEALAGVLAQLEGYEAPATVWEAELLPARMTDYAPSWLDEQCSAGRTLWTRLRPVAAESRGGSASL